MAKRTQEELEQLIAVRPETKKKTLDTLVVESHTVPFDADSQSINYMSSVLTLANFKMIQAVANGATMSEAYDGIYKTVLSWKNANNTVSNVQDCEHGQMQSKLLMPLQ